MSLVFLPKWMFRYAELEFVFILKVAMLAKLLLRQASFRIAAASVVRKTKVYMELRS